MDTNGFAVLAVLAAFTVPPALASETLLLDKSNDSIVSGTITRVQGESVFVTNSGRDIEIELDNLGVDRKINDLFQPGMQITAKGRMDDDGHTPVLKADEIVRSDTGTVMNTEALLLNKDED